MTFKSISIALLLAVCFALPFNEDLRAETDTNKTLHGIHFMMNHGLNMIMDGSSLIMLGEMGFDTTHVVDPTGHGNAMIEKGQQFIDRALRGPTMVEMHVKGMKSSKIMDETHLLGELILKAAYKQDKMHPPKLDSLISRSLHIIHIEANHALMMAAQGSNMVMTGENEGNVILSRYSIEHGKEMMLSARETLFDLQNSKAMKDLENRKLSDNDERLFKFTKDQLLTSIDIANILIRMEVE